MKKRFCYIWICIVINLGCSNGIAAEDNATFYAKQNKASDNIAISDYEIIHFNDTNVEV